MARSASPSDESWKERVLLVVANTSSTCRHPFILLLVLLSTMNRAKPQVTGNHDDTTFGTSSFVVPGDGARLQFILNVRRAELQVAAAGVL